MNIEAYGNGYLIRYPASGFNGCSGPGCCNFVKVLVTGQNAFCCMGCRDRLRVIRDAKYKARKKEKNDRASDDSARVIGSI